MGKSESRDGGRGGQNSIGNGTRGTLPKKPYPLRGVNLTIDPGITGTGVATWDRAKWDERVCPIDFFNVYPVKVDDWRMKLENMLSRMYLSIRSYSPSAVYIEMPEFRDDAKGHSCAKQGDLMKLSFMVGGLYEICRSSKIHVYFIPVHEWKGQLSKEIVKRRVLSRLPLLEKLPNPPKSHSWDAIALGLYVKGHFGNGPKKTTQ